MKLVMDQLAWNRSLRVFCRYGLVEVTEAGLVVHRLVQAATRDRLSDAERQAWATTAMEVVAVAYPRDTYRPQDMSIWARCSELLSHARVTVDHVEALAVATRATGKLLTRSAQYLQSQGRYGEAEPLFQRAQMIREKVLGANHPDVAQSLNNLASLYQNQGRYEEAAPLYQQALAIADTALGPDHANTQIFRSNYNKLLRQRDDTS